MEVLEQRFIDHDSNIFLYKKVKTKKQIAEIREFKDFKEKVYLSLDNPNPVVNDTINLTVTRKYVNINGDLLEELPSTDTSVVVTIAEIDYAVSLVDGVGTQQIQCDTIGTFEIKCLTEVLEVTVSEVV